MNFLSVPSYFKTKSATDFFDDVFFGLERDLLRAFDSSSIEYNSRFSSSDFLPADIKINKKTKQISIEVALVGCNEDDFTLVYDDGKLKLSVDKTQERGNEEVKDDVVWLQNGLKRNFKFETSWAVNPDLYDVDNIKVEYKNGLLSVAIDPRAEVVKKEIKTLFGKLKPLQITDGGQKKAS